MGKVKDITEAEKYIIVKEMSKGTPPKVIATSIVRHVDTVKRYLSNPSPRKTRADAGVLERVTDHDRRNIKMRLLLIAANLTIIYRSLNTFNITYSVSYNFYARRYTTPESDTISLYVSYNGDKRRGIVLHFSVVLVVVGLMRAYHRLCSLVGS